MKVHDEAMYWLRNEEWFIVNEEKDCFELTDAAPQRAVDSFRLYLLRNDRPISEAVRPCDRMKKWKNWKQRESGERQMVVGDVIKAV